MQTFPWWEKIEIGNGKFAHMKESCLEDGKKCKKDKDSCRKWCKKSKKRVGVLANKKVCAGDDCLAAGKECKKNKECYKVDKSAQITKNAKVCK